MSKKIIFHIPLQIDTNYPSGSQIRPLRMIDAFKNIGYDVDVVMGYGRERKQQIERIKKNIKNGIKYDFLYAENATSPSLLTEKNHLPLYPLMDFSFMQFCKNNNIKIGLFYRDIYWAFDDFMKELPLWKAVIIKLLQRYDLYWYKKLLNVLYLPSLKMYDYIPDKFLCQVEALPPAIVKNCLDKFEKQHNNGNIKIFYVGGIGSHYDLKMFCKVVSEFNNVEFVLCCRDKEWNLIKNEYISFFKAGNIKVVHASGKALIKYYENADITSLYLKPYIYREFAMPVKLFEYMSFLKPIIATKGTASGTFVEENNIGWNIKYDENSLREFFNKINKLEINKVKNNMKLVYEQNTWEARAKKVAKDLSN